MHTQGLGTFGARRVPATHLQRLPFGLCPTQTSQHFLFISFYLVILFCKLIFC